MSQKEGTTILVKKPDGTLVRVPLSDLVKKKQPAAVQQPSVVVQQPSVSPPVAQESPVAVEQPPASTAPAKEAEKPVTTQEEKIQPDESLGVSHDLSEPPVQKEDHSSLLEEEFDKDVVDKIPASTQYNPSVLVDEIMQDLPMSVAPELQMRMRQSISSLVRGVRDPHHFHETVVKSIENGGLGFTDEDAARIVVVAQNKKKEHEREMRRSIKQGKQKRSDNGNQNQQKTGSVMSLSTTTPVRNYFEDVARANVHSTSMLPKQTTASSKPVSGHMTTPSRSTDAADVSDEGLQAFRSKLPGGTSAATSDLPRPQQPPRTARASMQDKIMHDMRPAQQVSNAMGPLEEMERFALADLRRLSSDPDRAAERIVEKLTGWQEESYLLYLDARKAWFRSPLFKMYQEIIHKAIEKGQTIDDFLRVAMEQNGLHPNEIRAIVEINRRLAV